MIPLADYRSTGVELLFTDIDDTMTDYGQLTSKAYEAVWRLTQSGIKVVPITGRPAGWCELIARMWPVDGVVGENGGFYFRYHNNKMLRHFAQDKELRLQNQKKLKEVEAEVLAEIPGADLASDQFCRLIDLAVDFCEDVKPLEPADVDRIVAIFEKHGAQAKVSSIHVNGWFGEHNKLTMCQTFVEQELGEKLSEIQRKVAFVGDSPNDEPMFSYFQNSFAVANIEDYRDRLDSLPKYCAPSRGGQGFVEVCNKLIDLR